MSLRPNSSGIALSTQASMGQRVTVVTDSATAQEQFSHLANIDLTNMSYSVSLLAAPLLFSQFRLKNSNSALGASTSCKHQQRPPKRPLGRVLAAHGVWPTFVGMTRR